ncbi:hypothetical protein AB0L47_07675 [Streptomyces bobili]|uniref:hypothetical protein n=1 Tax=Streptomyces bobili TaxID=67280 RepID=UPI0034240D52
MKFGSAFPADGAAFDVVEEGEGLLNDVAELAQALAVRGALAGDDGQDLSFVQLAAVGVAVVALVAEEGFGPSVRSSGAAGDRRNAVDQVEGLDVLRLHPEN